MGLGSYFKAEVPDDRAMQSQPAAAPPPPPSPGSNANVLPPSLPNPSTGFELQVPRPNYGGSGSRRASISGRSISGRSVRSNASSVIIDDIKHEVMVNYLYQQQNAHLWVSDGSGEVEGVLLKKSRGNYLACPAQLGESRFAMACAELNLQCAMTVNSRIITSFLSWTPDAVDVPLRNGLRVQILPSIEDLPKARKHQFAAFVADENLLVVWDDDPLHLIQRAKVIETELTELVFQAGEEDDDEENEKKEAPGNYEIDEESGQPKPESRPVHLQNAAMVAVTMFLVCAGLGGGFRALAMQIVVDGTFVRLALIAMIPVTIFFSLFFGQALVGAVVQMGGPVKQLTINSKYYSAKTAPRLQTSVLPHVTIQCPVYKEGLTGVIAPTVKSIKQAISTYELQGGSANIFFNDDGMQLISEEERQARIDFYADHSIGWVARPKHGENGFLRRGKFKKASNMNFGLMISCRVEEKLAQYTRGSDWTQADEAQAYEQCLKEVLEADSRAWADGNIRIGDYILIIDSDTRVPSDCLLDAVSEMEQSPNVGIIQFSSGVMQVVHNFFENGITYFTNLIYTAIRFAVANGDIAPFVGHNAILRWSAIQQVSFHDEDGYEKFWSESHVSEDFDMALRLQVEGYIVRLAAWAGDGFKEGVSLTVYDEIARWEKYAYGCNELVFNPMRTWLWRGPFTKLFRQFLGSNMPFTSKITLTAYIGTYYAIGGAWIMTVVNYFVMGWFAGYVDKWYMDGFSIMLSVILVFTIMGAVAVAVLRYRCGEKTLLGALCENFKWTLMLLIFFGGLSMHVSSALLAHMLEIDMTWGATSKEAEFSNFWIEVPKVLKEFKYSMLFALFLVALLVCMAYAPFVPWDWRIISVPAVVPLADLAICTFLIPLALNPALMTFSW